MCLRNTKKRFLLTALLGAVVITSCSSPSITTIKEPVLGTEKHQLSGYYFEDRSASTSANIRFSCRPDSKKNADVISGTLTLGSRANEYTFDENIKLFLAIDNKRHELNIINRTQKTMEVNKSFLNIGKKYVTMKGIAFEGSPKLVQQIRSSSDLKLIVGRIIGNAQKEVVDILTLYPYEFTTDHDKKITEFLEKCSKN